MPWWRRRPQTAPGVVAEDLVLSAALAVFGRYVLGASWGEALSFSAVLAGVRPALDLLRLRIRPRGWLRRWAGDPA